ncbi:MAG: pyruvate kinase [Candidatus Cloacimonetes bacterium]|nr:pyruvate kinase [Candidatus Cloacimonadota bacterium]MCF7813424.1 pyruvate kinase [Candidatus Cloacimonadota bacterium]MCF7867717.1 pyruvate kinase [Candidatus Cloacimonadota bacterium]MCF7883197.1 pyruvate kinase [Candidatus Cloacimonadota bacterium]
MQTETKIICTIGPASSSELTLLGLAGAGMNVARLNMSHGDYKTHQQVIDNINKLNTEHDLQIKILMDLEGYRIRIAKLEHPVKVEKDEELLLSSIRCETDKKCIAFDYDGDLNLVPQNSDLFIDDGHLRFKILEIKENSLLLKTIFGGTIKSRKGINIPDLTLPNAFLNEQDKADIKFGVENNVDLIAQSFVCNAQNIELVRSEIEKLAGKCGVFAKIENAAGVKNIDSIIDVCDGIMVARGDLGISLPVYKVPAIQKYIISRCSRKKKHVIIATQMLESMLDSLYPTRAEVSDIANAIYDKADYLMLSAETAVGKYPVQTVEMMRKIIEYTEDSIYIQPELK